VEFAKGHGTENDFVLLPDADDGLELTPALVRAICDRHAGVGADGVLRVVRDRDGSDWFMDYRNADGSVAEMCGNGVRVMVRWLADSGWSDPAQPLTVATRGGIRAAEVRGELVRVDMGRVVVADVPDLTVSTGGGRWPAQAASAPNPHAVAFVDDLDAVGPLTYSPVIAPGDAFPDGVNVEFVVERGPRHVALRGPRARLGGRRARAVPACAPSPR
jgi:diaminopimelate epimerase